MSENRYLDILIESLQRKIAILTSVQEQNAIQAGVITASDFDDAAFNETIEKKSKLITELLFIDNGFESVYNRIKDEIQEKRDAYADKIRTLQKLIGQITDLSTQIQASEQRNDMQLKNRFRGERQKLKQSNATVKAVTGYYKSMSNLNTGGNSYMDWKQ